MRRESVWLGCSLGLALASGVAAARPEAGSLHQQLLDLADRQQKDRRAQLAQVKTRSDLEGLQRSLREKLLRSLGGPPEGKGVPSARGTGTIEGDGYTVEKLALESLPGYHVPALLYRPAKRASRLPGILSPCGHSPGGKAAPPYQTLHINLAKRGFVVLTYDPVGQGERSQFWDLKKGRSRFNLTCGEHAVLGTPLYLLGSNLARFRVRDGLRALDYLASRPEVDPARLGCVGSSGGGTLTAYIAALDSRVKAAAICCYITTLPRRMGNRIQADPDTDPEQDLHGFVSEGIDHAGLLALRAPRPTLLGTARLDFFPVEGARESFAEAKALFEIAGAGENIERVEAAEKHGLTLPLRKAVYAFFERRLAGRKAGGAAEEIAVTTRAAKELLVCRDGQVNLTFRSRHLLTLALEEFDQAKKPARKPLADLLRTGPDGVSFRLHDVAAGGKENRTLVVCVNGNEARGWQEEEGLLRSLEKRGYRVAVVDPRGVGKLRPDLRVEGHEYADPLCGVESNLACNAFLVGRSLLAMRVADVRAALGEAAGKGRWSRVVLCGRRDSALVCCFAAAIDARVTHVAAEDMPLSYRWYFDRQGRPVNPASILPGLLRDFGDIGDVLAAIAPRKALVAAGRGKGPAATASLELVEAPFSKQPERLPDWLGK
jgi:cephalosporin-C deacetylase-like acetyl esterase